MDVLGVGISVTSMPEVLSTVSEWIESDRSAYVCVTGVHGVMESQRSPELLRIHNESGLAVPDGRPMLWCGRIAGATRMRQVRGEDLTVQLCRRAAECGWPVFFYGGAPGTPEMAAERLSSRCPGLMVAGAFSPPFRPLSAEEDDEVVEMINASGAKLVWVGLSTPKQERWMASHVERLSAPVLLGVGAAFDLHAGLKGSAPRWLQPLGLEWFYRLLQEPRRLWRRYLINNPKFVLAILRRPPKLRLRVGGEVMDANGPEPEISQ